MRPDRFNARAGSICGFHFRNCFVHRLRDLEPAIEARDVEDFVDLWLDTRKHDFSVLLLNFFVEDDQIVQRSTGQEIDGGQIK